MKPYLIAAIVLCLGQGRIFGVSFKDTRAAATDIVVADVINGFGAQSGSDVRANASIQVVRLLQGDSRPGLTLSLEWSYHPTPLDPRAANVQIPAVRGLFFLKKKPSGTFEPLQLSSTGAQFGGVLVQLPKSASDRVTSLPPDAPLDQRLAREVQWGLEELVRLRGGETNARPANAAPPAQIGGLFEVLDGVKIENSLDVYRELSAATDPILKLAGLMGRARSGDTKAILEMEAAQASLKPAYNVWHWSVMSVDLRKDIPAAHAMGRIALSEAPIPIVESAFPSLAAATRNVELLPYLAVMLKSPNLVRDSAVMAICQLIGPLPSQRSKAAGLWEPEMSPYCPMQSPISNTDQEQKDLAYWSRWWESHNFQIGQMAKLPTVKAPARYEEKQPFVQTQMSIEHRFQVMLGPRRNAQDAQGQPGRAQMTDPITMEFTRLIQQRKLDPADLKVWNEVADATAARIADTDKRAREITDRARTQGRSAALEQSITALSQELEENLKAGLQELRSRLSKDGWTAAESTMNRGAGVSVRVTLPPPAGK